MFCVSKSKQSKTERRRKEKKIVHNCPVVSLFPPHCILHSQKHLKSASDAGQEDCQAMCNGQFCLSHCQCSAESWPLGDHHQVEACDVQIALLHCKFYPACCEL